IPASGAAANVGRFARRRPIMSHEARNRIGGTVPTNGQATIQLALDVSDPTVVEYLQRFDASQRPDKALKALKEGDIAIRSASPTLDAQVVGRLLEQQLGPGSDVARALDPNNKKSVVAVIEARVQALVEAKLEKVLEEFSLDRKESALSRFRAMLGD